MPQPPTSDASAPQKHILSVSEVTSRIKQLLENEFSLVWLEGEISNYRRAASGHSYFTLKDSNAQISAVIFKGQARYLRFELEDGLSIVGLGRISVYEPRGTYQIILELIEPKGLGSLQIAFEQLKSKLADEGLFDDAAKKPLPFLPRTVCLITSPKGAVVHDMLRIVHQRFPNLPVEVIPVRVQGSEAESEIVAAIALLNRRRTADVAILGRGGGSLEDFQAFNTEAVARAIFASEIPIVSAVGHETDFTIADFVADLRAPTPTAAASIVVPDQIELKRRITDANHDLQALLGNQLRRVRDILTGFHHRLTDPRRQIDDFRIRTDELTARMEKATTRRLSVEAEHLKNLKHRIDRNPLTPRLLLLKQKLEQLSRNINKSIDITISSYRSKHRELLSKLRSYSPMAVLERGYSITRTHPEKMIIREADSVAPQQAVEVLLARGGLICRVEGIMPDETEKL